MTLGLALAIGGAAMAALAGVGSALGVGVSQVRLQQVW